MKINSRKVIFFIKFNGIIEETIKFPYFELLIYCFYVLKFYNIVICYFCKERKNVFKIIQ